MTLLEGLLWLTLNVYHEGRSESQICKAAIVHVTINRATQKKVPIKDVVTEPYQFSWTFQKKSYFPEDPKAFVDCMKSVFSALKEKDDFTHGATHYHLANIHPDWASDLTYINKYGSHKFYRKN